MNTSPSTSKSPWGFFLLVFILSIPSWLIGGNKLPILVDLPVSSLMFVVPVIAASISHGADLFLMYFISATGEELDWMGYAIDPMQNRWGALRASIILGLAWAIWHIIPHRQQSHTANWILWKSLYMVALRILMVWIYNKTRKSVLAPILVHTVDDVSWSLFPNYGSHFNPFVTGMITCLIAVIVILFGRGPKKLGRYRYA